MCEGGAPETARRFHKAKAAYAKWLSEGTEARKVKRTAQVLQSPSMKMTTRIQTVIAVSVAPSDCKVCVCNEYMDLKQEYLLRRSRRCRFLKFH